MILKRDKLRIKKMLSDSITVLCRAGLPFESKFQVEALIAITLDDSEVVLVSFKETMASNGLLISDTECSGESEEKDVDENFYSEHTSLSLTDIPKFVKKESSSNCANLGNSQLFNYPQVLEQFGCDTSVSACRDVDNQAVVSSNKIQRQKKKKKVRGRELQPATLKCEPTDVSFHSIDYDQNFAESKSFHEHFEIQSPAPSDDCVVVKNEDSGTNECYGLNDHVLQEQIRAVEYGNFQAVEPSDNVNNSAYSQNSAWSHIKKPSKKLPLHQSHQPWTSKSTYSIFKDNCSQPLVKRSKDATSIRNEESEDSTIGRSVMQCAYCDSVFNRSDALKEHVNGVHFKKKLFHCSECGESFKWRAELSRHRRVPGLCPCGIASSPWPQS